MKPYILTLFALIIISCNSNTEHTTNTTPKETPSIICGDTISADNALNMEQLTKLMNDTTHINLKVKGNIVDVCQVKGCWMDVKVSEEKTMKVMFKDYAFFVPKDAGGKEVVMEGVAYMDTVSVEMLRHFALDAGKDSSEVLSISESEYNLVFEATGVLIQ